MDFRSVNWPASLAIASLRAAGWGLWLKLFFFGDVGGGWRQEYIISRRFPQKFGKRVLQQYKHHFKRISVLDNYAILESLPTTARTSLVFAQYQDAVDQLSFLQACFSQCWVSGGDRYDEGLFETGVALDNL